MYKCRYIHVYGQCNVRLRAGIHMKLYVNMELHESVRVYAGYIYVELWLHMYRDAHRCVVVFVFGYVHVHGPVYVCVYLPVYFTYSYLSMYVYMHAYT